MSNLAPYKYNVLGFELSFNGPSTAAEIATITGNPKAAEEAFMTQYAYQDRGPEFRDLFSKEVENLSGIKRKTKPNTMKDGTVRDVYDETEAAFLSRVREAKNDAGVPLITEVYLLTLANTINEQLGDWSPSVGGRSSKPSKAFYELADGALAKIGAGQSSPEKFVSNVEAFLNVSFESTFGEFNRDNVARAFKAIDEKQKASLARLA